MQICADIRTSKYEKLGINFDCMIIIYSKSWDLLYMFFI